MAEVILRFMRRRSDPALQVDIFLFVVLSSQTFGITLKRKNLHEEKKFYVRKNRKGEKIAREKVWHEISQWLQISDYQGSKEDPPD